MQFRMANMHNLDEPEQLFNLLDWTGTGDEQPTVELAPLPNKKQAGSL